MPFDDTIAGKEVPQAQTEGIARRLLGDDLVNRYGDVIGARDTTAADVLRDFTMGFAHGSEKVDEMHMKVQDTFRKAYDKQAERAVADKQADIKKTQAAWEAIKWAAEKAPRGYAASMLKEQLAQLGIEPTPTALKMLSDADYIAQLPKAELDARIADGTINSMMLGAYATNSLALDKFRTEAARRKEDDANTNRMVLAAEKQRVENQRAKLKLKQEKRAEVAGVPQEKDRLSIRNARLSAERKQQQLDKGSGGTMLEKILSGQGLGAAPSPVDPRTIEQPVEGAAPVGPVTPVDPNAVAAAKARLGLK